MLGDATWASRRWRLTRKIQHRTNRARRPPRSGQPPTEPEFAAELASVADLLERVCRPESAVVEHQPAALGAGAGLDLSNEENVVARTVSRVLAALEPCDTAVDERSARHAQPIRNAGEAVGVRSRKAARKFHLIVCEHIDRISLRVLEGFEAYGAAIEAPHHERRVERHRVERVRGEADETTLRPRCADDRDACGELCEGIAKVPGRERG